MNKVGRTSFQQEGRLTFEGKDIPVAGHGSPYGCETSRFSDFLDIRLTSGGKVVSLRRRPPFTAQ
jgi:hypothetical protein